MGCLPKYQVLRRTPIIVLGHSPSGGLGPREPYADFTGTSESSLVIIGRIRVGAAQPISPQFFHRLTH